MVKLIVSELVRVMHGTKHEKSWMFYRDALSTMTCQNTINWMKESGFYRRWVLLNKASMLELHLKLIQ